MKYFFLVLLLPFLAKSQANNAYLNEQLPGNIPQIFAEGIVSDNFGNRDVAISPQGDEIFFTLQSSTGIINAILYAHKLNGKWSAPEVAVFSGVYSDLEPAFSPDGNTLYFSSNRPLIENGKRKDYDIWFVKKENNTWSQPQNMGTPVNSDKNEFYASIAKNGNIYFTRAVEDREEDIMICKFQNNKYQPAESLPDAINSTGDEFNAFVDPDEKFILFSAYGRADDLGGGDIYISKKSENDQWQSATHLDINSKGIDYCPYISPDKKYFFFTSNRSEIKIPFAQKQTIQTLHQTLTSTLNGADNIYWMKADAIIGN